MTIVFPFHEGACSQAEFWLEWVRETKAGERHEIILMPGKQVDGKFRQEMDELAKAGFRKVSSVPDHEGIDGHPKGPNSFMRQAVWHCQMQEIYPWMFCEPDNIPLHADSFDAAEAEYLSCGKPFWGSFRKGSGLTPDYLSGNMILPKDALLLAPKLTRTGLSRDGVELAFDIVAAEDILPRAFFTKLLQQEPKHEDGSSWSFATKEDMSIISPQAKFFHPCKDGSLIKMLRVSRLGQPAQAAVPVQRIPLPSERTVPFEDYLALIRERDALLQEVTRLKQAKLPTSSHPVAAPAPKKKKREYSEADRKVASEKAKAMWAKRRAEAQV